MNLQEKIENLKNIIKELKEEFGTYIQDTSIPLVDRWQTYLKSDGQFSDNKGYMWDGLDFIYKDNQRGGYVSRTYWYEIQGYERYQTVKILNVVDQLQGYIADITEGKFGYKDKLKGFLCLQEPGILDKIKEQILKDNIWSFEYDW